MATKGIGLRTIGIGWATLAVAVLSGCGSEPLGVVRGKVTLGNQPVTQGSVVFENLEAGVSVNSPINDDGTFEVRTFDREGLPPGTYQVAVSPRGFKEEHEAIAIDPEAHAANTVTIPKKFHLPSTSGLTFEVQEGENFYPVKLE